MDLSNSPLPFWKIKHIVTLKLLGKQRLEIYKYFYIIRNGEAALSHRFALQVAS